MPTQLKDTVNLREHSVSALKLAATCMNHQCHLKISTVQESLHHLVLRSDLTVCAGPDLGDLIDWTVNMARSVTKWNKACAKRLVSCNSQTKQNRQDNFVENNIQDGNF